MGYLKGKSALMVFDKYPQMGTKWDRAFWARGYYVSTVGELNREAVEIYIAKQQEESYKEDRNCK
jgi:putative transposase